MTDATTRAQARRVELILERLTTLPTLSAVAQKLLAAGSHDDVDIQELAKLIEADPSLTGRVLSMCRSADLGLGDKITSVQRAITLLGLDAVTSAVLSVEVFEILSEAQGASGRVEFDATGHWRHAIAVAAGAELVARAHFDRGSEKHGKPETAFVAGLLHSIGRIAMEIVLPDAYSKVLRVASQRGEDSARLEREIIGIDHAAAGKRLAEHWGLPKMLRDCVWMHAQPVVSLPSSPHRQLVCAVAVSRALARRLNLGWSGDFGPPPDVREAAEAAGFDSDKIEGVALSLVETVAERSAVLGLSETTGPELMLESVLRANVRLAQLNSSLMSRSAHGEQQRQTLKAIAAFNDRASGRSLTDVLAAAACSARDVVGGVFAAAVIQTGSEEPWQAMRFTAGGELDGAAVEPPPALESGETVLLADIISETRATPERRRAVLPWMNEHVAPGGGIAGLRVINLPVRSDSGEAAAMLVVDDDLKAAVPSEVQRSALISAWAGAVSAAVRSDAVDRLADELTDRHADLARTQAKLAEAQSMAKLGEMTAGAAHELNNPLTVIKGYGQILRNEAEGTKLEEAAGRVADAAQDLSDLITSLHMLAEPPKPRPARSVVAEILADAMKQARSRAGTAWSARLVVPDKTPAITTDAALLARALSELIVNAAESDSEEIIEIRVQTDPLDDRLMVVVKDRGRGMDAHTRAHAFDPFFSGRSAGRGTGLGLARARRLIEQMGGSITLASETGEGTKATVTLPGWRVEPEEKPAARDAA